MTNQSIVVIGAGVSGLAAAHRVLELAPDTDVRVLEASGRSGGLICTERRDGFLIEQGPDSIITEKPAALALVKRLGLEDQVIATNDKDRGAFVVTRGRLERIPAGFSMMAPSQALPILRSPILSPRGKLRMLAEVILPRRRSAQADESARSFVERRFGRELLERLAQPLIGGIYGTALEELSLKATIPRFASLETEHRSVTLGLLRAQRLKDDRDSGVRYGLFFSFKNGVETLTQTLSQRLGSRIRLNAAVKAIERVAGRYELALTSGEVLRADKIVFAIAAPPMAQLLSSIAPEVQAELAEISLRLYGDNSLRLA